MTLREPIKNNNTLLRFAPRRAATGVSETVWKKKKKTLYPRYRQKKIRRDSSLGFRFPARRAAHVGTRALERYRKNTIFRTAKRNRSWRGDRCELTCPRTKNLPRTRVTPCRSPRNTRFGLRRRRTNEPEENVARCGRARGEHIGCAVIRVTRAVCKIVSLFSVFRTATRAHEQRVSHVRVPENRERGRTWSETAGKCDGHCRGLSFVLPSENRVSRARFSPARRNYRRYYRFDQRARTRTIQLPMIFYFIVFLEKLRRKLVCAV